MVSTEHRQPPPPAEAHNMPIEATASDSRGYTQASAEKHAVVIAEVWKNEDGNYNDLRPFLIPYDRVKAEGLLATISQRRYREVADALRTVPVGEWTTAFHRWITTFRTDATKNVKDRGAIAPTWDEYNKHCEHQSSTDEAAMLQTIEELEQLEADLREQENTLNERRREVDKRQSSVEERETQLERQRELLDGDERLLYR
ncbi:hypothetical protein ACJ73_01425 [Blastomyces percursus]|uniref:Uncharacterized protein n=1 Tax=Blastomyces percursus TaxID=1658174 RepID=A0A1J9RF28_9EURO|nr:hypothetical protein ACJ73_01425 [Blastomyces percursus]